MIFYVRTADKCNYYEYFVSVSIPLVYCEEQSANQNTIVDVYIWICYLYLESCVILASSLTFCVRDIGDKSSRYERYFFFLCI